MKLLLDIWERLQSFVETGGPVLVPLFCVTFAMWLLILERLWYLRFSHPRHVRELHADWLRRPERTSWYARQIRRLQVSEVRQRLGRALPMIRTLVALCPLLGLLGTVTGMIEVFDIMAVAGSGNPRAMAAGVSRATIPTMAGMVAALSGIYFSVQLTRRAQAEARLFEDRLACE